MLLKGKVRSGIGDYYIWMEKLQNYYFQKTNIMFFPGTLNIELPGEFSVPTDSVMLDKSEYGGDVSVYIIPCRIMNREVYILRTEPNEQGTGHHPKNIIEIASNIKLRTELDLVDGDEVEIEIDPEP